MCTLKDFYTSLFKGFRTFLQCVCVAQVGTTVDLGSRQLDN